MSTHQQRDLRKEHFWRRKLEHWRRSGSSIRAFCARHRLAEPSFYSWRRTLAQREADAVPFVPVQVVADPCPAEPLPAAAVGLELLLAGGRVLRIGPDFDGPTLQRLLAVLAETPPCS
jgi:hypothetical protein